MRKKIIRILWKTLFSIIGVLFVIFVAIWNGWIGYMPDIEDLQNPISKYASQIYSADGKVLGTYNENRDNRIAVGYAKLSPYLVQALVATEDERFYEHSGIDFIALSRAILKRGIMQQHSAGGGSTITQQLAKQLYSEKAHSTLGRLLQKPIEWIIAVKLERNFTKEEIIAMYLNYFDYLHNAVGIKSAANTYFRKEPQDLTVTEAATLIGLCKNPSLYNPVRYPERCVERRNVVLSQMQKAGYMSSAECDKYSAEPLGLNFHRASNREQTAPYFREYLRQYMMAKKPDLANYPSWNKRQYHIDSIAWETDPLYGWCNKNLKKNGDPYDVNTDGLRIYTTIDTRMQKYAEEAVYEHMTKYLQPTFNNELRLRRNAPFSDNLTASQVTAIMNRSIRQSERYRVLKEAGYSEEDINKAFDTKVDMTVFSYKGEIDTMMTPRDSIKYYKKMLRAGFVSMDPMTGAVKAYVGGVNYNFFQYDMGMMGRRQVGSTIKPFLYSMAMQNGYSPCDVAPNVARTYIVAGKPWTPRNGSRSRYGQMVTLKWGLAQSNNWISAYLMSRLNPHAFVQLLNQYGINNPDIHPSMALCLGPCEVSVGEMVSAYTAFVNHGIRCAPMMVTRIEDNSGNVLAEFQPRMNEVISESSSYKMLVLLKAVVEGGTGGRLRARYNVPGEIGGKTGTTNKNSDAWFMGVTPQLVSGCWVGGEDRDIHFVSTATGQGAAVALPIWAYYMKKIYADKSLNYSPDAKFDIPDNYDPCAEEVLGYETGIDEVYE